MPKKRRVIEVRSGYFVGFKISYILFSCQIAVLQFETNVFSRIFYSVVNVEQIVNCLHFNLITQISLHFDEFSMEYMEILNFFVKSQWIIAKPQNFSQITNIRFLFRKFLEKRFLINFSCNTLIVQYNSCHFGGIIQLLETCVIIQMIYFRGDFKPL